MIHYILTLRRGLGNAGIFHANHGYTKQSHCAQVYKNFRAFINNSALAEQLTRFVMR
jgi:hypothetical protein